MRVILSRHLQQQQQAQKAQKAQKAQQANAAPKSKGSNAKTAKGAFDAADSSHGHGSFAEGVNEKPSSLPSSSSSSLLSSSLQPQDEKFQPQQSPPAEELVEHFETSTLDPVPRYKSNSPSFETLEAVEAPSEPFAAGAHSSLETTTFAATAGSSVSAGSLCVVGGAASGVVGAARASELLAAAATATATAASSLPTAAIAAASVASVASAVSTAASSAAAASAAAASVATTSAAASSATASKLAKSSRDYSCIHSTNSGNSGYSDSEDDRKVAAVPTNKKQRTEPPATPTSTMGGGGKLLGPPPGSSSNQKEILEVRRLPRGGEASDRLDATHASHRTHSTNEMQMRVSNPHVASMYPSSAHGMSHAASMNGAVAARGSASAQSAQSGQGSVHPSSFVASRNAVQYRQEDPAEDWEANYKQPSIASTPRVNAPIPGSVHDPATFSIASPPTPNTPNLYKNNHSSFGTESDDRENLQDHDDRQDSQDQDYDDPALLQYATLLRTHRQLEIIPMEGDGNCLFRAISLQIYGDPSMHMQVRHQCLDFMQKESAHFQNFVADEPFAQYLSRKRLEGVHGNHAEIQAASELYNRSVEVYVPDHGVEPINIFHREYKNGDVPIRVSYHDGNHYNAVVDPLVPTAGLGLGLPGLEPGLADKMQLEQAKEESKESGMQEKMRWAVEESAAEAEEEEVRRAVEESAALAEEEEVEEALRESELSHGMEDAYKKKALYLSEMEAADFDLEQAVLASSLDSYRNAEQERKQPSSRRAEARRKRNNASPTSPQRSSSTSPVHRSTATVAAAPSSTSVASFPRSTSPLEASSSSNNYSTSTTDEYPASVQELVMNGFELSKVLHAYDLIGDNFDDLLSFLLSSSS